MGLLSLFTKKANKRDEEFGLPKNDKEKWCLDICSIWCFSANGNSTILGGGFTAKSAKLVLSRDWGLTINANASNELLDNYIAPMINSTQNDKTELAWEYCCAGQLLCLGYAAEIIDRNQYNTNMFEIAKKLQINFTDWEDMVEKYFEGYLNQTGNEDELDYRIKVYSALKADSSPNFATDWNTNFNY